MQRETSHQDCLCDVPTYRSNFKSDQENEKALPEVVSSPQQRAKGHVTYKTNNVHQCHPNGRDM